MKALKKFLVSTYGVSKQIAIRYRYLTLSLFFFFIFIYFIVFFVINPDLANALVALGTLILAVVASLNIVNSNEQEKRRREEGLLKEIMEWAIEVSGCGIEKGYPDISNLIDLHSVWLKVSNNIGDIVLCFKGMRGKNQYIGEIVKALHQDLQEVVKALVDDFEEHIRLLSLCETYMRDREKAWERTVIHKHKLNFSAKKVIEEAAKIKTRDIS